MRCDDECVTDKLQTKWNILILITFGRNIFMKWKQYFFGIKNFFHQMFIHPFTSICSWMKLLLISSLSKFIFSFNSRWNFTTFILYLLVDRLLTRKYLTFDECIRDLILFWSHRQLFRLWYVLYPAMCSNNSHIWNKWLPQTLFFHTAFQRT